MKKLLFIAVIFLSCSLEKNNKKSSDIALDSVDSQFADKLISLIDTNQRTKILFQSGFHGDEVWEGAENEKWWGLFKDDKGYFLEETSIAIHTFHDGLVDYDENIKTGKEIVVNNNNECILLVTGLNYLKSGRVLTFELSNDHIYPGDTVKFNFLGGKYLLYATGTKQKSDSTSTFFSVKNYNLYLSEKSKGITQLIVSQNPDADFRSTIFWFGDIDRDRSLDLLIDMADHYNISEPTLFLSLPAKNKLVVPVGSHRHVGC